MCGALNFDAPRAPARRVSQPASPRPIEDFLECTPTPPRPVCFVTRPAPREPENFL